MKKRDFSKSCLTKLALMGLAAGLTITAQAGAAQGEREHQGLGQQVARGSCGVAGCGSKDGPKENPMRNGSSFDPSRDQGMRKHIQQRTNYYNQTALNDDENGNGNGNGNGHACGGKTAMQNGNGNGNGKGNGNGNGHACAAQSGCGGQ
ncbi:MAG: hypothetical protein KDK48_03190 [Chlamydiia bacterium]|nr:hypothetical protein [Chlamydiia bacterium]